jgi:hypothetical protein
MSRCDNYPGRETCHMSRRRSVFLARHSGEREKTMDRAEAPSFAGIATLESLREHLQWAIELEHFTLPPYLCVRSTRSTPSAIRKPPRQ